MMQVRVLGIPAGKGSMKAFSRGGKVVMVNDSRRTGDWQSCVALAASCKPGIGAHMDAPVKLRLSFFLPRPKSSKRVAPTVKPDLDKLTRCVLDALTGVAYHDDAQVMRIDTGKWYDRPSQANEARRPTGVVIEVEWYVEDGWVSE